METEGLWAIVVIAGPILLAMVLLWALLHNRTSRTQRRKTEEATHDLYRSGTVDPKDR